MSIYVVTGGAGFIGSNIVLGLVEGGHIIRVVDDLSTGLLGNLDDAYAWGGFEFYRGSICDDKLLSRVFAGADFVLHQAALPSVQRSTENPMATNMANVTGTLCVLRTAVAAGVKRVVYASSSSVYGDRGKGAKHESMVPMPKSVYAASKLAGEHYCRAFNDSLGLETVCLRYFNVFGPHQSPHNEYAAVIPIFINCILNNQEPTMFGDGNQTRDFTYVDNVVQANIHVATAKGAAGQTYNVATGQSHSVSELLGILYDMMGKSLATRYVPTRVGDVKQSVADIHKARSQLGYRPRVSFEQGLRDTIAWQKQQAAGSQTNTE